MHIKTHIKTNKYKHAYIKLQNISPPFCQFINKGVQTIKGINNIFLPFCINQTIKVYMLYTFMKRRDVKLTPPAYMHLYEKRWLNPNHIKHNMQCIKGDVKHLLHTCTTYQRKVNHFSMTYTQHEYIYREKMLSFPCI